MERRSPSSNRPASGSPKPASTLIASMAPRLPTVAATALSPGALPDAFLRPLVGFNDIWMEQPTASSTYDSLQVQVSRRFTGRFEMAGSYTLANGKDRWIISPDGLLWNVPWASLILPGSNKYAVEEITFRHVISGRELIEEAGAEFCQLRGAAARGRNLRNVAERFR